jgi:Mn-dependent DtxR family transcriptional regulator
MKKEIILNEREYIVLYLTEDQLGYVDLITKRLNISENEVENIFRKLMQFGLVIEYEKGGSYVTTAFGKNHLNEIGRLLGLAT